MPVNKSEARAMKSDNAADVNGAGGDDNSPSNSTDAAGGGGSGQQLSQRQRHLAVLVGVGMLAAVASIFLRK